MEKERTIQRKHTKKKKRPKIRFNFWVMFIIFIISFVACFVLYMLAANFNDDFFEDEFDTAMVELRDTEPEQTTTSITTVPEQGSSITNPVPLSDAVDGSYFDTACLVTDSTLIDMGSKGKFDSANVFASAELNAANCTTTKIGSSFGTVSVYDLIKNKKPEVLYIMLGSDLGESSTDDMLKNYTMLVNNLHSALPDMKIYIMQLPPVIYDTETLTSEMINDYNNKLLAMCNAIGVYCIDTNTALKSGNGMLDEAYYSYETLGLSAVGYMEICQYIMTHTS